MSSKPLKDHREIGRELDLFSFHEYAPGAVFWHPKGLVLYNTLQQFIREITKDDGYQEISTPIMVKSALFKKSGHWEHFKENMFNLLVEEEEYSLKPMNCPESTLVYASKTRSYQDLPIKFSEFGILHRNELSGTLGGLLRVRQFTIDDAHLYLRPDQIQKEIHKLLDLVVSVNFKLAFTTKFYLSTKPDKAMGDTATWQQAEKALGEALKASKSKFDIKPKDGAFYGPKIDIHINDSQDRDWQLATIQLDFQIPERMELEYIDSNGKPKRPVMIHRAILGTFERFIGILLEHTQGNLPLWLSPVQAIILPITDKQKEYARELESSIKTGGIRAEANGRNETLQAKIRDATLQKIPYLLIVGEKEEKAKKVAVRTREGKDLGQTSLEDFRIKIDKEIAKKA